MTDDDSGKKVLNRLSALEDALNKDGSNQIVDDVVDSFNALKDKLVNFLGEQQRTLLLFNAVFENAVDGLITIDSKGRIQQFNKASERLFGYEASEVIGQNVNMLMPEPYQSEHDGYLRRHQETGERKIIGIGREVEGKRKDGSTFPMDLSVSKVALDSEILYSGIVRDISERKESEEAVLQSNEELERFAYIVSHDLQEPLRMVQSFADLLEDDYGGTLDERAEGYIHHMVSSARRMQGMINDLLEYSRLDNQEGGMDKLDANERLAAALENLAAAIQDKDAKVTSDDLPMIKGNRVHFTSLLQNLVGNAIKYTDEGVQPQIHIGVKDNKSNWLFSIKDNGIGIAEEDLSEVFTVFQRAKTKKQYKGTGIGLAICKKIVKSIGGDIWVESAIGKGSTFYFTIPKT